MEDGYLILFQKRLRNVITPTTIVLSNSIQISLWKWSDIFGVLIRNQRGLLMPSVEIRFFDHHLINEERMKTNTDACGRA